MGLADRAIPTEPVAAGDKGIVRETNDTRQNWRP